MASMSHRSVALGRSQQSVICMPEAGSNRNLAIISEDTAGGSRAGLACECSRPLLPGVRPIAIGAIHAIGNHCRRPVYVAFNGSR